MRSNRQSKTGAIQLRKTAARKIKRHRDRRVNKQSSGAVVADLKYRLLEIYDLNAAGSLLTWDQATYMPLWRRRIAGSAVGDAATPCA
jgi:hypothetical protein